MKNQFIQRKKSILIKSDKSSIGKWDEKIVKLCQKINSFEDCYTTSSCSGRIMIIKDESKKAHGLFKFVSHDLVKFNDLIKKIPTKGDFRFKQESPILHVACKDVDIAKKLLKKIRDAGWKRAGIISLGKNVIIEVIGTGKIEFPLVKNGRMLVDHVFLKEVLIGSNENLKIGWEKIEKLRKLL